MPAPIALFAYARPEHTRRTVEALQKNHQAASHDLIIFSDEARSPEKQLAVNEVRAYLRTITGFRSVSIHQRLHNFGLAKSIIDGVSHVLLEHERIIVLEDDMVTSPHFLTYMNEALEKYADNERVVSIHAYVYPTEQTLPEAFFLRGADCWGWATWKRGWRWFNPNGQDLLNELKGRKLIKAFDMNGACGFSEMLEEQIKGRNDSWAVRWYASAFLANKLTLYPGRSLVNNIGNDSSGTHCSTSQVFDVKLSHEPICLDRVVVEESETAKHAIERFLRSNRSIPQQLLSWAKCANIQRRLFDIAKGWLPPVLVSQLRRIFPGDRIKLDGPFSTWEEAASRSSGYDSKQIIDKVLAATLKVKNGAAVYERDSVLFDEIQYAWPVTAGLMWVGALNCGRLSVLDFGGSLGSSYFQNRKFLEGLGSVRWSVVEQWHYVEAGRQHIQDENLIFYPTITECIAEENPNVVLLSCVLQYLEKPYEVLEELIDCGADVLIVDRTPFLISGACDLIKIQITPPSIYPARYPIRYFKQDDFVQWLKQHGFDVIERFPSLDKLDHVANWSGLIFKRRLKI